MTYYEKDFIFNLVLKIFKENVIHYKVYGPRLKNTHIQQKVVVSSKNK